MYTGKHAAKKKKTGYFRIFVLWSLMLALLTGAAGFVYVRVFEGRIHGGGIVSADEEKHFEPPKIDEPVTFLLLGSDTRGGNDQGRADTIIVLRANPAKNIAYLISIPRDTRVKIPGYGRRKINSAYQLGGPSLTAKTIEEYMGIDIHHYAVVDFQGFKEVVDAIGGVDIDVEKRMVDSRHQIDFYPGYQHMDGEEALKYCRIRKVDDDFGRIERQQKFLKVVMNKVMKLRNIIRIPELAGIASRNLRTDRGMGVAQMISYGNMMREIGRENVHMMTLPSKPKMINGVSFVVPEEEKVAWLLDRMNNDLPPELTDEEKQNNNIEIEVQNGSGTPGIARKMADKLTSANFKIKEVGNAQSFNHYETRIITTEEKENLARRVQAQLGLGRVFVETETSDSADIVVIVGRDFSDAIGS